MNKRVNSRVLVPLGVAVAAALVAAVAAFGGGGDGASAAPKINPTNQSANAGSEASDPNLVMGATDAPVVMVMYTEFQCPYCGKFARETQPELIERFVDDGTLRMEWRDLPYLGAESTIAAKAGRAAAAQERFWEFQEAMFADQPAPNSGAFTKDSLAAVADELGLDVARFREDMASSEAMSAVQADIDEGVSLGITGTPAFLINGQLIVGAQPTEVFVDVIEQAAAA